jgi:hypothetical protein
MTGVAILARVLYCAGANTFRDLTADPLLSRVLCFSTEEICASFPAHLRRLASLGITSHRRKAALGGLLECFG